MRNLFIHEDEEFISFCEANGFDPMDREAQDEYRDMLSDRYTNPHA